MESLKRNWGLVVVALVSLALGAVILLTVSRIGQQSPVAPTAPTKQKAFEGVPVAQCVLDFAIVLATPTPTPTPSPSPSSSPSPTPTVSPSASPSPSPSASPSASPSVSPSASPSPTPSPSVSPSPSASPEPSATPFAQCQALYAFQLINGVYVQLTAGQLALLQPGDTVRFAVLGSTNMSNPDFDRAHFRVNGLPATWQETTATFIDGGNVYFYIDYTLLPGVTSYSVESEIHSITFGWL